jgi:imidazoleglycerol phosphate dehydratase HisB
MATLMWISITPSKTSVLHLAKDSTAHSATNAESCAPVTSLCRWTTLAIAAVDLSGRAAFTVETKVRTRLVGDLQTELVTDFFEGFARGARANVHVKTMYGRSNHHKIEAIFKAFARALRVACSRDKQLGKMLPSTKGLL